MGEKPSEKHPGGEEEESRDPEPEPRTGQQPAGSPGHRAGLGRRRAERGSGTQLGWSAQGRWPTGCRADGLVSIAASEIAGERVATGRRADGET